MAIKMKSSTSQTRNTPSITVRTASDRGLCRTVEVVINNDGTVNLSKPLDLGYKGDNKATYIHVNLDNLNFGNLTQEDIENQYIPYLNFQSANGFHKSYPSEEANWFFIDSEITNQVDNQPVTFLINFALVERTDESIPGNVEGENADQYKEIFVSQIFTGIVMPNGFANTEDEFQLIDSEEKPLVVTSQTALHKPEIQLNWDGVKLTPSTPVIGFVGDRLITPIHLQNFPKAANESNGLITVFFSSKNYKCKAEFENVRDLKFWLPYEITSYAIGNEEQIIINNEKENSWYIALKIISGEAIAYTPFTEVKILASLEFGEEADVQEIYTTLYDANNAAILDSNGDIIEVPDIMGGTAQIEAYDADQIEAAIGWVYDKQTLIEAHLEDASIHITAEEKEAIHSSLTSLGDRLTTVEETVSSFDTNIQSQVEVNTSAISSLQQTAKELKETDGTLTGRIQGLDLRLSNTEIQVQENTNSIAGVYNEISKLNNITDLLDAEKEARIRADIELNTKDNQLESAITTSNERIKAVEDDVAQEATDRASADTALGTRISQNTTAIGNVQRDVQNIQNDATIIRNDSNIAQAFVAKIIFLSSEAEYQTLVDEGRIEANTLYLIQEEEE